MVLFLLSCNALFFSLSDFIVSLDNIYQRKYKRLSDRLFDALECNIVLYGSCFSSKSFYCYYGIIVLLTRKVASRVKSDGLKAMLWCRVVVWEIMVLLGVVVLV